MATRISAAVRSAMVAAVTALIDGGPAAATIQIRSGAQPASVATAASGTLLATVTVADPAFAAPVNGVATANAIPASTVSATGSAGWFRVLDSAGVAILDGSITISGGGGDMTMATVSLVATGTLNITSWTITQPAG